MDKINIGDIIQPTTPKRLKLFGKGIIISIKQAQRLSVTVVFPAQNDLFVTSDFKEGHVSIVKCTKEERKQIVDAAYKYRQLIAALKHA